MKRKSKYPPYPESGWDYAVKMSAASKLQKPNKCICIYCYGQALTEELLTNKHESDCPARKENVDPNMN